VQESLLADQEQQIVAILHQFLDYPFQIKFTYLDSIPRSPSGKYEDFLCLLDA